MYEGKFNKSTVVRSSSFLMTVNMHHWLYDQDRPLCSVTGLDLGSPRVLLVARLNLEALIAGGIQVGASGGPLDQVVQRHQRDGNHRHRGEEDDDGEHPVWIRLHLRFGE